MTATRAERGLVALLLALSALAWWSSAGRMDGMDMGRWTPLGGLGWFIGVWTVMMAAMMLPSAIPAIALYGRLAQERTQTSALVFAAGYLAVWAATGFVAYGISRAGAGLLDGASWAAGATLLLAAAYQLTPLKDACLTRCRSPLGMLLGSWRPGRLGALRMGATLGAWCLGCCWALMACLFALGVMSIAWMAFVAALVALEKLFPCRRLATGAVTVTLAVLGVMLLL